MADPKLGVVLELKDKFTMQFKKAFDKTRGMSKRFSDDWKKHWIRNAAIIAGVILVMRQLIRAFSDLTKSIINVSNKVEQYQVRLKVLLKSQEKGNQIFKDMAELAGRVPKTYDEIMAAATDLTAVVRDGVREVNQLMPIIVDLSAATGMAVREVVGQIIRMYSAGAAAADMFRERGVSAALGFQAGVQYTAKETMRILIQQWEDGTGKFVGASKDLAKTFTGMVSMFQDAWFQLRSDIGAPMFDAIKLDMMAMLKLVEASKEEGGKYKDIVKSVAGFFKDAYKNAQELVISLIVGTAQIRDGWQQVLLVMQKIANAVTTVDIGILKLGRAMPFGFIGAGKRETAITFREMDLAEGLKRELELEKEATENFTEEMKKRVEAFREALAEMRIISEAELAFTGAGGRPPAGTGLTGAMAAEGGAGEKEGGMFAQLKKDASDALSKIEDLGTQTSKIVMGSVKTFSTGVGKAFANMIVYGESFKGRMEAIFKGMAANFIAKVTSMFIEWIAFTAISKATLGTFVAFSTAMAAQVAAAWATAAAMVNAATFGAGAAAGAAGITSLNALTQSLAAILPKVPALAEGGIVERPTLAMIGEKGPEAVVPLSEGEPGLGMSINIENASFREDTDIEDFARQLSEALEEQRRARI